MKFANSQNIGLVVHKVTNTYFFVDIRYLTNMQLVINTSLNNFNISYIVMVVDLWDIRERLACIGVIVHRSRWDITDFIELVIRRFIHSFVDKFTHQIILEFTHKINNCLKEYIMPIGYNCMKFDCKVVIVDNWVIYTNFVAGCIEQDFGNFKNKVYSTGLVVGIEHFGMHFESVNHIGYSTICIDQKDMPAINWHCSSVNLVNTEFDNSGYFEHKSRCFRDRSEPFEDTNYCRFKRDLYLSMGSGDHECQWVVPWCRRRLGKSLFIGNWSCSLVFTLVWC